MGKKKKNLAWLIITICICVIFIPIIIFNSILSIKSATNPDKLPTIFGVSPTAVMTGSMEPEINAKDLVFIKEVDPDTLKEKEDIICFVKDGEFITHRIERIEIVDGVKHFYTKGDANNAEDRGFILAEQIQGKLVGKIAGLGGVIMFLQSPYGLMLVVILLVMLYIAGELLIEWRAKHKENIKLTGENKTLTEENAALKAQLEKYTQTATTEETPPVVNVEQEDDTNDVIITENGLNIRYKYKRSFMARLIQGGENLQDIYTTIKNYILKHEGVKSRISWGAETFSNKRNPIAKLCVRGKTLYAYLALTDEEIANLQIDEKVEENKYATVPAKIKVTGVIKSNRTLKAIDVIMARLGLSIGEEITEKYSYAYETDEQLLEKGLVKLVESDFVPPVQDEKQEVVAVTEIQENENSDSDTSDNGLNIKFKYKRSFLSRLIQSGENTQNLYTAVKNYLLKYKDVKNRNSWSNETFYYKRNQLVKLCVRGKTIYAYLALTDEEIANLQIDEKVETSKYSAVPAKIRITGIIKLNRALKAIDTICARFNLVAGEEITETYSYPYETDEQLIEKGLIKSTESNFTPPAQE